MDLLQEYKELYYKEIEYSDRLNNKMSNCITFLTILGSAQILLWTQLKNYDLLWYTGVYIVFCSLSTILFIVCIYKFFKTYSGYKTQMFPIKDVAIHNMNILNQVDSNQIDDAKKALGLKMAERFINDAINNRNVNTEKNNRHRRLIQNLMASFVVTFIAFAINIAIDYYETSIDNSTQQIYLVQEVKLMSEDVIKVNITSNLTDTNGQPINIQTQQPEVILETFTLNDSTPKK